MAIFGQTLNGTETIRHTTTDHPLVKFSAATYACPSRCEDSYRDLTSTSRGVGRNFPATGTEGLHNHGEKRQALETSCSASTGLKRYLESPKDIRPTA
ncbi:hypothetical protein T310_3838 [Rasamsonia emersonii CBS 393.64]|uniref:Uncharacterized protein n=1 Tax=Rasamsonia emersonii (strain ATCC 16479 / CBS 393.64 / IMI 116815) TaxID=1408163 RepID=A0A0F4YVA8_RASE3|nr:hypothetical protein T310_3838 [Rasamsonia emersonii CBS 393.64]KKA22154.1 hypothetical protein T310_3838 [Rasamsonia emersonii CBS 393.64]